MPFLVKVLEENPEYEIKVKYRSHIVASCWFFSFLLLCCIGDWKRFDAFSRSLTCLDWKLSQTCENWKIQQEMIVDQLSYYYQCDDCHWCAMGFAFIWLFLIPCCIIDLYCGLHLLPVVHWVDLKFCGASFCCPLKSKSESHLVHVFYSLMYINLVVMCFFSSCCISYLWS